MNIIRTRFPPEPNGYLHMGHIKSMYYNFGYPFDDNVNKECFLRLDDTNPKTETMEYENQIRSDLEWMGYKPDKISNTSDYFEQIYNFTIELIEKGIAYVDLLSHDEMRRIRHANSVTGEESPYRNNTIEFNLKEFKNMKLGVYKEGEACLRLLIPKEDRTNDCMIDPIAYRIIDSVEHYKTGNKWIIYPSYEYSHYIVDSLEGITHSFCTLEFYVRRPLSYWICDKIGIKPPIIVETNRLDTDFGTLSKRRIKALLDQGDIDGWDDPRLLTISALKNKGITPEILKDFCAELAYSNNANAVVPYHKFESVIRTNLNTCAPRRMFVQNPVKITIINYTDNLYRVSKPLYPQNKDTSKNFFTSFNRILYIDRGDFKTEGVNKKYKRFSPNRVVRVKYGGLIKYINHDINSEGDVVNINVEHFPENTISDKVWGTIHWVSYPDKETMTQHEHSLISYNYPDETNKQGSKSISNIYLDHDLDGVFSKYNSINYQMERLGYYNYNKSTNDLTYLCSLKESNNKNV